MWRTGVGVIGGLLACTFLAARPTSARQPCRVQAEDLALTLQEVRIDGVIASQIALDRYATDAGSVQVPSEAVVIRLGGAGLPLCMIHESDAFTTPTIDPFTGEEESLLFEVAP